MEMNQWNIFIVIEYTQWARVGMCICVCLCIFWFLYVCVCVCVCDCTTSVRFECLKTTEMTNLFQCSARLCSQRYSDVCDCIDNKCPRLYNSVNTNTITRIYFTLLFPSICTQSHAHTSIYLRLKGFVCM